MRNLIRVVIAFVILDVGVAGLCAQSLPPVQVSLPVVPTDPQTLSATPTFDCTKAWITWVRILCADQAGANADWDINAAYWATLYSLGIHDMYISPDGKYVIAGAARGAKPAANLLNVIDTGTNEVAWTLSMSPRPRRW
jgi:hypothetical protein